MTPNKKPKDARLGIRITPELNQQVRVRAALEGIAASTKITQMLEQWVNSPLYRLGKL